MAERKHITGPACIKDFSVRRFGLLFAALMSVCAYPALFVYCRNIREAAFAEALPSIFIFTTIGLAAWALLGVLAGTMSKGAGACLLFMLVFIYYSFLENGIRSLMPGWRWWRIAPAIVFLFINLALFLRYFVREPAGDANIAKSSMIIGGVFLALILYNAASGLYTVMSAPGEKAGFSVAEGPPARFTAEGAAGNKPNFYLFILDEYSRQDVLKKYTGYDNTPFLKKLEKKKFNVSYSSYSRIALTIYATGDLLHYTETAPGKDIHASCRRPPLFELFKQAGYTIYALSPIFSINDDLVNRVIRSSTVIMALSITKTVLARSFFEYLKEHKNEDMRSDILGQLQQAADIVGEHSQNPKFLYFHLMSPHEPFIFDENGDTVAVENISNYNDPKYYAAQLRFLNGKIDALTDGILEKDPGSIVLIMADHGVRFFPGHQEKDKLACLNTLYLKGQEQSIEGISTVNTLRLAINHALNLRLPLVRQMP